MHVVYGEKKDLPIREAVRGVLRKGNEIGIIKVRKYDCLIFPGGGVDDGENLHQALKREMLEETGFNVNIKQHILTTEYAEVDFIHINHYYECEIVGDMLDVAYTDLEVELGIIFEWCNINDLYKYYINLEDDIRFGERNCLIQRSIKTRGFLLLSKYLNNDNIYFDLLKKWIGREVEVTLDRPIGYIDKFGNDYPVNYGYISYTYALDGEELDAYLLDSNTKGKVIAVVYREDDEEEKLIVSNVDYSVEEIYEKISFNEQHFDSKIIK